MSESRNHVSAESMLAALPEPEQAPSGSVPVQTEAAPEVLPPPFEGDASLEPPPVIVTSGSPDPIPSVPVRRRTGEDLIGDLFETMHELHFMPDMVSGAEFVQNVLSQTLPCDGMLIHVFDINKREFIVIRASGPNARDALLHITSDPDPRFSQFMRSPGVFKLDTALDDERFSGGRWQKVGVPVETVLVGGVKQGGRYLGVIELANPMGGEPFSDGEVNALDYICGQFADFLVNRPIITDRDVVIGKS
jgi:GAF domain-containing protein